MSKRGLFYRMFEAKCMAHLYKKNSLHSKYDSLFSEFAWKSLPFILELSVLTADGSTCLKSWTWANFVRRQFGFAAKWRHRLQKHRRSFLLQLWLRCSLPPVAVQVTVTAGLLNVVVYFLTLDTDTVSMCVKCTCCSEAQSSGSFLCLKDFVWLYIRPLTVKTNITKMVS